MGRMGIRKQVLYLVLSCSLITLFVAGGIALYGIYKAKSSAIDIGFEIGMVAADSSSKALKEVSITSLQGLVSERSKQIDTFLESFIWDVSTLANEMNMILQNPQNYSLRRVSEPRLEDDGKLTPQLQYRAGVNRAALATEVGLTANLQDFLIRLYDNQPWVGSTYVASESGFNITTDVIAATRVDANNNPLPNDYSPRPWYRRVMQEKRLIVTDVFLDSQGRGPAISCAAPYYDAQGRIAGVVGEGVTLANINEIVKKTKMGETGFAFVMDNTRGNVIFTSKTEGSFAIDGDENLENDPVLFESSNEKLAATAKKMAAKETGVELIEVDGKNIYLAYAPLENANWSFGVAIEEREVILPAEVNKQVIEQSTDGFVASLNDSIRFMIIAMLVAFVAIIVLVPFAGRTIADKFTHPLNLLTEGVREIASGNLDKKIDIKTGNEIEHLATCFNAMTDELKNYMNNLTKVTAEKERIATELDVAKDIQISMLPQDFDFERDDFELFATMHAAKEVGGDFYDFYLLDDNHLVITIADVSGKGVPAALFMAISKTILKNFAMTMSDPNDLGAVVTCSNNQLCQNNDAMMFVTVFTGMIDLKTGEFIFVNGGHNPPLVYKKSTDKFEYLTVQKNFVLGGMEDMDFAQQKIQLEKGDMIYLYTDGITEALNNEKELYGEQRLIDCLNRVDRTLSADEILEFVRKDIQVHVAGAEQSDDMTMVLLKI